MRSIKWCHSQWPWTNPNPVFKVTPLVGAKYLTNGYRYGHSYYRPEQTNTQAYTRNSIILSLTNVTDRQKSPVFCCKKSGNPRCLSDLSQNVLDALSCRRQSFRQVWYKSAVDCTEMLTNVQKSPIPQWWRTWKSDPESTRGSRSPPKVPHFQRVTSCPCLPSLVDIRFHVRQLYCLQNDRTTERSHVVDALCCLLWRINVFITSACAWSARVTTMTYALSVTVACIWWFITKNFGLAIAYWSRSAPHSSPSDQLRL